MSEHPEKVPLLVHVLNRWCDLCGTRSPGTYCQWGVDTYACTLCFAGHLPLISKERG